MAFERPTLLTIYNRVVADMEARITASQGGVTQVKISKVSLLGVLAAVFAGIMHMIYGYLSYLAKQLLPDVAEDEWLVRHANLKGLTRNPATYAQGTCVFTGTTGVVVPRGTVVQDASGVQFTTDTDVELVDGTASVAVTAVEAGVSGNTLLSAVTVVSTIPSLDSAATLNPLPAGGTDQETIDHLHERLLEALSQPPSGGRAYDYESWAKEVDGVTNAWALDAYNGPGTVGILLADGDDPVSEPVRLAAAAYLEEKKVLGTVLFVENIEQCEFAFTINLPAGEADKQATVTSQLTQLFLDESEPAGTILISHVNSAILSSLVSDYEIEAITKNGSPYAVGNLVTTGKELPTLGTITYGVL